MGVPGRVTPPGKETTVVYVPRALPPRKAYDAKGRSLDDALSALRRQITPEALEPEIDLDAPTPAPIPASAQTPSCPLGGACPHGRGGESSCDGWYGGGEPIEGSAYRTAARKCQPMTDHDRAGNLRRRAVDAKLAAHYVDRTWDDPTLLDMGHEKWRMLRRYAETFFTVQKPKKHSLVLHGDLECGKTQASALVLGTVLRKGGTGLITTPKQYADAVTSRRFTEYDLKRELTEKDLLVIDELGGVEGEQDWIIRLISEVIITRDHAGLPTIITTNHDPRDTMRHYLTETAFNRMLTFGTPLHMDVRKYRREVGRASRTEALAAMKADPDERMN